jgi:2-polyprenyl-3-methyl-5-hydroxy-6-metoxy-1,4-benzoquinol methylase
MKIKRKFIRQWDRLGRSDPYWAVLTIPEKKGGKWDIKEFFATGESEISETFTTISSMGLAIGNARALDFGCGVGRLSRALSKRFVQVASVDISSSMLDEAKSANAKDYPNISYIHNTVPNLEVFESDSFDFVYSNIVLQHMSRSLQLNYIREFCRILKPNGVMVFQTPSRPRFSRLQGLALLILPNFALNLLRLLKHGHHGIMEMHWTSVRVIEQTLALCKVALVSRQRYDVSGPAFVSFRYIARKPPNQT